MKENPPPISSDDRPDIPPHQNRSHILPRQPKLRLPGPAPRNHIQFQPLQQAAELAQRHQVPRHPVHLEREILRPPRFVLVEGREGVGAVVGDLRLDVGLGLAEEVVEVVDGDNGAEGAEAED